jgi:predicted aspartyl protease
MRKTVTCLLGCLVVALAPVRAGDHGEVVTRFDTSPHGGIVLPVVLDGQGPFPMILDTGSTHSVITARVAAAIGAKAVAKAELSTTAGSQMLPVTLVDCLQLGPIAVPVLPTVVGELPVAGEADGLIGLDVLADRHFTIDYRRGHVVWHGKRASGTGREPLATGGEGDVVRLDVVDGRFVVDALVDGRAMSLVLDSASEVLVLFGEPAGSRERAPTDLDTLVQRAPGNAGVVATLRIGRAEQQHIRAVHLGRPLVPGEPAGLVPIHGFSRVTIDGPRRRLKVQK